MKLLKAVFILNLSQTGKIYRSTKKCQFDIRKAFDIYFMDRA